MPDDELSDLATRGKLRQNLDRHVRRMLGDPKAKALVENFAGSGLQLRNLDLAAPDKSHFRPLTTTCAVAMRPSREFIETIVREDRSVWNYSTPTSRSSMHDSRDTTAGRS